MKIRETKRIDHITYVNNKVAKGIGIVRKARKLLNKKALLNLYHTFIFPYLIYCVEIWRCAKRHTYHPYTFFKNGL